MYLTHRENIDPQGSRSDVELESILRAVLNDPSASSALSLKFRLDAGVEADGINFSAGERQIRKSFTGSQSLTSVALIRGLAKNSKILLLDEATSSVDVETDRLVQKILQTHCKGKTVSGHELVRQRLDT